MTDKTVVDMVSNTVVEMEGFRIGDTVLRKGWATEAIGTVVGFSPPSRRFSRWRIAVNAPVHRNRQRHCTSLFLPASLRHVGAEVLE